MEDACLSGRQMQQCPCSTWSPSRRGAGRLVARPSFWQLTQTRKARAWGEPAHLVVHEDVLVSPSPFKCGVGA